MTHPCDDYELEVIYSALERYIEDIESDMLADETDKFLVEKARKLLDRIRPSVGITIES